MKNLARIFDEVKRKRRYATVADVRKVFGDYHNALHWLAVFLIGDEELAQACIVDACTIAETQPPIFHEWLIHWAALATLRTALQRQHVAIVELAPKYEKSESAQPDHPPLSAEHFRLLTRHSKDIYSRLDVLCRFVLVMRGLAKDSLDEVAAKLGIARCAVQRAYSVAFDAVDGASYQVHRTVVDVVAEHS